MNPGRDETGIIRDESPKRQGNAVSRSIPAICLRLLWVESRPVPKPEPSPDLAAMNFLWRISECLRYTLLDIEYGLSPGGELRGMARKCLRFFVLAAMFLLSLSAVLWGITMVMGIVAVVTGQLEQVALHLLFAMLYMLAAVVVAFTLLAICGAFLRSRL